MCPYAKAQPFSKLLEFSSMNMKVQCIEDLCNEPYQATLKRDFQLQTHSLIALNCGNLMSVESSETDTHHR